MKKNFRTLFALILALSMAMGPACGSSNSLSSDSGASGIESEGSSSVEDSGTSEEPEVPEGDLAVLKRDYTIKIGAQTQMDVRLIVDEQYAPLNGVKFVPENPSIVSVDAQGVLRGLGAGETTVSISYGLQTKVVSVVVENIVLDIQLDKGMYSLPASATAQVTAQAFEDGKTADDAKISYEVADESVVKVNENGLLTGVANGKTMLTVSYQGMKKEVPVVVYLPTTKENVNTFSEEFVNTFGRTYMKDNALCLDHVASALEVAIVGTSLSVELSASDNIYVRVFVDDEEEGERFEVKPSISTYTFAKNLGEGYHKIRIVKSSELYDGTIQVKSVQADGFAVAPSKGDLKIEFIGDSITAGYGVLAPGGVRTIENSDGCYSFAYKTAQRLGADYSTIALQGICAKAYQYQPTNMYTLYQQVSPFTTETYDFSFNPNIIVLNLGTNEAAHLSKNPSYAEIFPSDYQEMLSYVREKNPNAYILCVYGMMWTNVKIENGIKTAIKNMSDDCIEYMPFIGNTAGANGHPNQSACETWSQMLAEKIQRLKQ